MSFLPAHPHGPTHVNFSVTERCNRACPDCCYGIHILHPHVWEIGIEELREAARVMGPMRKVILTGGEPSFHRQFPALAQAAQESFRCTTLGIETNAYGFKRHPEAWLGFHEIHVTHYLPETYAGSPPNTEEIAFMQEYLRKTKPSIRVYVREIDPHYTRRVHENPKMCDRGRNGFVTYFKGSVYGCCSAQGVEGAVGVPLTPEWRDAVTKQELPCARCLFAGPCV